MAKKRVLESLTAAERVEVATLERNVAVEERAEASMADNAPDSADRPSRSIDERVVEVFPPAEAPVESEVECFLREAREAQAVLGAGEAVSPGVLRGLVARAVGLLSR